MDAPEEIKQRLDIVDLIGDYLPLKPAGSGTFKAACPFHQEKTPSFYVSRPRQSWHCFGCDQGGDHFTFVEKMEGLDFREALELLAQKTGIELPQYDENKASERKRLYEVIEMAVRFYREFLHSSLEAEVARTYLKKRGVDDLAADLFKLGYAPSGWTRLSDALIKNGVTQDELIKAGLASLRPQGNGIYDRFRERLMFPICDVHGRVVGFTGRILTENKQEAKYVNTPETVLYRKSAILYGLEKAKGEIRSKGEAVIVEGNMDVLGSHQFGVTHVVASSGTALTTEQLALLKRFTTKLYIAFDADAAGLAATLRGLDLARQEDFSIKIISLPPEAGKDPDEAVRKDPAIWKRAIDEAVEIMEWIYVQTFRRYPGGKPEEKKMIAREILTELRHIVDPVERDHWIKKLARDLDVSEDALREVFSRKAVQTSIVRAVAISHVAEPRTKTMEYEREERFVACSLIHPLFFKDQRLEMESADFASPNLGGLYMSVKRAYINRQYLPSSSPLVIEAIRPPTTLTSDETKLFEAIAFFADREFVGLSVQDLERELFQSVQWMRDARKARERRRIEQMMRDAERRADSDLIALLLKEFEQWK